MSQPETNGNDPTMDQAMAALEAAEKRLEAPANPTTESATQPQPTAPVDPKEEDGNLPEPKPGETGTPATTETEPVKTLEKPATEANTFSKNAERKNRTWIEINAEKEATRAESARVKAEREAFERERVAFEKKRVDSQQANIKPPEFYENGATELERAAELAEGKGDFDRAAELKVRAKDARAAAKEIRERKPDPTVEETNKAFSEEQKKWLSKAGIDYPDFAKKGPNGEDSPSLAKYKSLTTPGSDGYHPIVHEAVKNSPAGAYYASMLAHSLTVAARVPTLEKDLAEQRAEVKKLNGKLSVNGGGLVNGQPSKPDFRTLSLAQMEEQLRSEANGQSR